jgi:DNA-binding FadR family transcriptional regulator
MSAAETQSEHAPTLVQHAIRAVTDHIRKGRLKAGDGLPSEMDFAKELNVSRAVIREAFGALAALRLIDVGNGRRARVRAFDGGAIAATLGHAVSTSQVTVSQVWDVRRTLEKRTAALAAMSRTDPEAEAILRHARAMKENRDNFAMLTRHDIAFHQAIAAACHNILFQQIVASFEELMSEAVPVAWRTRTTEKQRNVILARHVAIAEAIAQRDADAAEKAMAQHFDDSIKRLLDADSQPGP